MADHANTRTIQLYDRRGETASLGEFLQKPFLPVALIGKIGEVMAARRHETGD